MKKEHKKLIVGVTIPGSVNLLRGQLRYFTELGYDTYLLTQQDEQWSLPFCKQEGCKPLDVKIAREISVGQDIRTLIDLLRILKSVKPDIVNFGTPKMSFLGLIAAWICRIPKRVYTCRGLRYESEKGKARVILKVTERIAAFCSTDIICISPSLKEVAIKDRLFNEEKCVVINKGSSNGIDLKQFNFNNIDRIERLNLQRKLGIQDNFVFGFIGRIRDDKGINELFEAFKVVYRANNHCRLLVVGPWQEEHIKNKALYGSMINHPGVILPGRTDSVALFLSIMDVFIMTTWREGFGNVYVQAAALGIPVIGSNVTGSKSAVCHGFNGTLVNPHSISEITNAMLSLLNNSDLRAQYGKNGIEWARNFSNDIIWNGMDQLYQN